MLTASYRMPRVDLNVAAVNREASKLATIAKNVYTAKTRMAMIAMGAMATGQTYRTIRGISISSDPITRYGGGGIWRRQVQAGGAFRNIRDGRRPGAKMPIYLAGLGPRGGKRFEPLPAMLQWFETMNIPREAWFPIMRAIKLRGIRPRNVPAQALRHGTPVVAAAARNTAAVIASQLIIIKNAT